MGKIRKKNIFGKIKAKKVRKPGGNKNEDDANWSRSSW
jgi:hypothetical protein